MGQVNPDHWNDVWVNSDVVARRSVAKFFGNFPFEASVPKDARIVDIGCGSGTLLRVLKEKGYRDLRGFEPEAKLFAADDLGGVLKEGNCLDFGEREGEAGRYDVAIIVGVLHHMKDMPQTKQCLKNVHTILKPGGRLYSIEPWKNIVRSTATFLLLHTFLGGLTAESRVDRELVRMEKKELDAWLEVEKEVTAYAPQAGLKVVYYKKDLRYRYITFEKA